eukprot:4853790-Prymnesium_polylepis.3
MGAHHTQGCSSFLMRRAQSGKSRKKRTSPTRTRNGAKRLAHHIITTGVQAGVAVPDGPACTSPPAAASCHRVPPPHERRIPRTARSPQ